MKHKIYGSLVVLIALFTAFYVSDMSSNQVKGRYHQHIYAKEVKADELKDDNEFKTHLPIVLIDTFNEPVPGVPIDKTANSLKKYTTAKDGSKMTDASIKIIDNKGEYNYLNDEPKADLEAQIRVRGSSSRYFPKKNYLIRLTENKQHKYSKIMGMNPHYEWALHGPYLDKTLMRNYMWYNISGEIMEYAPNVRYCEVFLNNKYIGLYLMTETVSSGEENSRINLKKEDTGSKLTSYLLRLDRGSSVSFKNISTLLNELKQNEHVLDIKFPRKNTLTREKKQYIIDDFSSFEKRLYSYDYDTNAYGYWNDIDVQNFVDYYIINEFSGNLDSGIYSTYIYKSLGGKYKKVVWDFNNACDNYIDVQDDGKNLNPEKNIWDFMLFKDEKFTEFVIKRYKELRETYLSEEYLLNYIDKTREYLGDAIDRNYEVWESAYDDPILVPVERNIHSYDEAIDQLKNYIIERGKWMDENIEILRQYSHESHVKQFNH